MRFKIIVFLLATAFLAVCFLGAYYYYEKDMQPEAKVNAELKQKEKQAKKGGGPDPGISIFNKAVDLLREKETDAAVRKLEDIIQIYRDSSRYHDARRMLGEINMDRLFSRTPMPGKYEYTVKPNDSLGPIIKNTGTTMEFLIRMNNLNGTVLHPGDRLVFQSLNFDIDVDFSLKILSLHYKPDPAKEARIFFKDYAIKLVNLPPGTLPGGTKPYSIATSIATKTAVLGEKSIKPTDGDFPMARKWLQTKPANGRPGILFRPLSDHEERAAESKKQADGEDLVYGIFLDDGDMEELSMVTRLLTPVVFHRS